MPILNERISPDRGENEIRETLRILFRPSNEDFKYTLPKNLSSRRELDKLRPQKGWAIESLKKGLDRTLWSDHGDGHVGRVEVFIPLLIEMMTQNGKISLTKEQKAAIVLAGVAHDLRYKSDRFEVVMAEITKKSGHQGRAAEKDWLSKIFADLAKKDINLFSEISPAVVVQLARQIIDVHDNRDDTSALKTLQKHFPDAGIKELPLELRIFRDIDSGLERLRTEEIYKRILNRLRLTRSFQKFILRQTWVESSLRRFHFPEFEETRDLLPFAFALYHKSIEHPEYKTDQWKAVMNAALELGAIKE